MKDKVAVGLCGQKFYKDINTLQVDDKDRQLGEVIALVDKNKEDIEFLKLEMIKLKELIKSYIDSQDSTDKLLIKAVQTVSDKIGVVEAEIDEMKGLVA